MSESFIPVLNTIISSAISLIVAFGTWHVSMKKDREKQTEEVKTMLTDHRQEYLDGIRSVQEDVSNVQATVQQQIGIVELKIQTLSDRVNLHNNLVERTYKLEEKTSVHDEKISVANHRIDDLERAERK